MSGKVEIFQCLEWVFHKNGTPYNTVFFNSIIVYKGDFRENVCIL